MKFSKSSESDRQEIEVLFTRTFSDSEGESEGKLIGHLVHVRVHRYRARADSRVYLFHEIVVRFPRKRFYVVTGSR